MSAKASGANPQPNGNATHRAHNDGSSTRAFTAEQKEAVIRIRKCGSTAFYDILGLESERATVTSGGIKKAYHKLSLLTHPDKNGYQGADEAFKMVSRAFQILSDADKKKRYDQFGGDPDNRFSSSGAPSNPFSGFARAPPGARPGGPMFEAEMSPEELFRQFFGGGLGGGFGGPFGGGLFDGGGPGFVFSGPGGIRVHQFGGGRPRRRPPGTGGGPAADDGEPPSARSVLLNLLPMLLLVLLPMLSSLLSSGFGSSSFSPPPFSLDVPRPPDLTSMHTSQGLGVKYFVDQSTAATYDRKQWSRLDNVAEQHLMGVLRRDCTIEQQRKQHLVDAAHGWFSIDQEKLSTARNMPMASCKRLEGLVHRTNSWL